MKNKLKKIIIIVVFGYALLLVGCDNNDEMSENSVLVERKHYILQDVDAC